MLDMLGQEIKVGDLVLGGSKSSITSYSGTPHVCTRIGSKEKIQVNGSSYGNADYMVVCTQQMVHFKGQEYVDNLKAEYAERINVEPVKEKDKPVRYLVIRMQNSYSKQKSAPVFIIT